MKLNQRLLTACLVTFVLSITFITLHLDAYEFGTDVSGGLGVLRFIEGTRLQIQPAEGDNTEVTLHIKHNGDSPVTLVNSQVSKPFAFKGGQFPGEGGNCPEKIKEDCTLVVSVASHQLNSAQGELKISYLSGQYRLTSYINIAGTDAAKK